ncbi:hypothetical protein Aspvir_006086 [Aspergillus viridinutans]|uniref:Methyltransferase n=1 Tax=Aspergillus viridinutans TaxID=75553 RepID=A0A9P3BWS5_ASPVI|nr:uncharacterized protein Aspvir_006086 [Aspergillus viridinutans]GIK02043.1 hypothetical protein Aspvir_006086 [Aspergillus viridinutans]
MSLAEIDLPVTTGEICFAKPGSWPANERPYTLLYEPATDEKLSNFKTSDIQPVPIRDMRPKKDSLSIHKEGFIFADFKSKMAYEDYLDEDKLKTVLAGEVRELLLERLGAKAAFIHECVFRRRGTVNAGNGFGQPVQEAHSDYTLNYAHKLITELAKSDADLIRSRKFQMINVWKPLRAPLRDWPLALCDYSTLDRSDLVQIDEVHVEGVLESHSVQYNPSQRWYYLSEQTVEEVLIFCSADSETGGEVPHAAFCDPRYPDEEPRESVELRVLVVY